MEAQMQVNNMIVYISDDGRLFAEIGNRLFELDLGTDVSDDILPELEIIKMFDSADVEEPGAREAKLGLFHIDSHTE